MRILNEPRQSVIRERQRTPILQLPQIPRETTPDLTTSFIPSIASTPAREHGDEELIEDRGLPFDVNDTVIAAPASNALFSLDDNDDIVADEPATASARGSVASAVDETDEMDQTLVSSGNDMSEPSRDAVIAPHTDADAGDHDTSEVSETEPPPVLHEAPDDVREHDALDDTVLYMPELAASDESTGTRREVTPEDEPQASNVLNARDDDAPNVRTMKITRSGKRY